MNIRKVITTGLVTGAFFAGMASSALAVTIDWNNDYRTGSGGEFTLVGTGLNLGAYAVNVGLDDGTKGIIGGDSFQTFCIEHNEFISKGQGVMFGLSSGAINGGVIAGYDNPRGNPDPVSIGTAYLYSQFAAGTLSGYNYNTTVAGRQASAGLLQNAIWYFEGEQALSGSNIFVTAMETKFGSYAGAVADSGGAYNVKAVNLVAANGVTLRQDQLYVAVPDGGSTLALLGLAIGSLAFVARRRKA